MKPRTPSIVPKLRTRRQRREKSPANEFAFARHVAQSTRECLPRKAKSKSKILKQTGGDDEDEYRPPTKSNRSGTRSSKANEKRKGAYWCNIHCYDSTGEESYCSMTFGRAADRQRHTRIIHRIDDDGEPCRETTRCRECKKIFSRYDALRRHLNNGCTGVMHIRRRAGFHQAITDDEGCATVLESRVVDGVVIPRNPLPIKTLDRSK